jgi:ethanolamine permease
MEHHLEKSLTPVKLWAIMVGMVISGQYFGWNYGIAKGGLWGFLVAVVLVIVFYSAFIFVCAELSTRFPKAGGPSVFVTKAFGPFMGFLAALACLVEFLFAVPAIAVAIGFYLHFLFPFMTVVLGTFISIVLVFYINLLRVGNIAKIELVATGLALVGLFLCYLVGAASVTSQHVHLHLAMLQTEHWNVFAAIPFAIWLFLAIEGGAMSAEEVKDPLKNIPKGFIGALLTIIVCTFLTVGITVLLDGSAIAHSGSPLPRALESLNMPYALLASKAVAVLGIFGLFASLNGITMGYSRQVYAMGEAGFLPAVFTRLSSNESPYVALLIPGIAVLLFAISAHVSRVLVLVAVLGAVVMYLLVLAAFFKLRYTHQTECACFKVPVALAVLAFVLAAIFLYSIVSYSVVSAHLSFMGLHVPVLALLAVMLLFACSAYAVSRLIAKST